MNYKDAINDFKNEIIKLYETKFIKIILFGSYARQTANDDSDIDLLVVLKGEINKGEEIDRMIDIITDLNLKYNTLISVIPVSESEFENIKSPLLLNVQKEGVVT